MMKLGIITFAALASLSSAVGVLFSYMCFTRSQLPYNALGRHFDGEVAWLEQASLGYGVMALFFFGVGLFSFAVFSRMKKSHLPLHSTQMPNGAGQ